MSEYKDKEQQFIRTNDHITPVQKQSGMNGIYLVDNRPKAVVQRKLIKDMRSASPIQQKSSAAGTYLVENRPKAVTQRALQAKFEAATPQNVEPQEAPVQKMQNDTGLPDNLKAGVENLSGYSMDDVKVHYNSDKPVQLQALAYAQGTDIHVGPGQEKHLPHEAWHVVQQKQGRVQPTLQMKSGVHVNDDKGLEQEADMMGARSLEETGLTIQEKTQVKTSFNHVVQRAVQIQIMWAMPGTPGFLPKTVHITEASGRPNGAQNDHTAAYVLYIWEARNAVEGKSFLDALESLQPIISDIESLPGFTIGTALEIQNRQDAATALWNQVDDVITDANIPPYNEEIYHAQILANFMERYINLRNTIPLSSIVGQPGGSHKNEGAGATEIDKFVRDNKLVNPLPSNDPNGNDVEHLSYALWITWDYRPIVNPTTIAQIHNVAQIFAQWYIQVYRSYPDMPEAWSATILNELFNDWNNAEATTWGWTLAQKTTFHNDVHNFIAGTNLHH